MSNKKFKFKIGNDIHEWEEQFISYEELAAVPPGLPAGCDLFIKEHGQPGRLIQAGEKFDLGEPGVEKFYVDDSKAGAGCASVA